MHGLQTAVGESACGPGKRWRDALRPAAAGPPKEAGMSITRTEQKTMWPTAKIQRAAAQRPRR